MKSRAITLWNTFSVQSLPDAVTTVTSGRCPSSETLRKTTQHNKLGSLDSMLPLAFSFLSCCFYTHAQSKKMCVNACEHACVYVKEKGIYMYIYTHALIYVCIYLCTHAWLGICIYTYIHTHAYSFSWEHNNPCALPCQKYHKNKWICDRVALWQN